VSRSFCIRPAVLANPRAYVTVNLRFYIGSHNLRTPAISMPKIVFCYWGQRDRSPASGTFSLRLSMEPRSSLQSPTRSVSTGYCAQWIAGGSPSAMLCPLCCVVC
jgi:hypothetical protein